MIDKLNEARMSFQNYTHKPFREYQAEATEYVLSSPKRFVFLEAPTGSGKSLIAMVAGVVSHGVTYSVHSKILQTQITEDFPEAKSLFGRSNYKCKSHAELTCAECTSTQQAPCKRKGGCEYEMEKRKVLCAPLKILNYDYLLSEANYVGKFSKSPFNIVDEADNLENTLVNFIALTFTSYSLSRLGLAAQAAALKKTSKNSDELILSWVSFGKIAQTRTIQILNRLNSEIDTFSDPITPEQAKVIKERSRVIRLLEKIDIFLNNVDLTWLMDDTKEDTYTFRPLWLTESLSQQFMWRHATKWVFMSATFLPIHLEAKRLGIPFSEVDYKLIPSTFPVERRPIHVESAANLTGKTMEEETPKLIKRIKQIITLHPKSKGLIHAVSYELSNQILDGVASPRLISHNSTNRQETLHRFMDSDEPLVLISPSMERGVSLEMDLCRFIIVAKAPFLYLGDKIVAARVYGSKIGSEWYAATMLCSVLQMTGRGMRSADDRCESYILDAQFKRVFESKPRYLPPWWKDAVEW